MKSHIKLSAIFLMVCCLYSGSSWAWVHGGRFGFYFGAPFFPYYGYGYGYPYGYPYAYPYYPPAIATMPAAPQTYIQQAPPAQQSQSGYWHYCNNPEGYYPYVKECPSGWRLVEPAPH